MKLGCFFVSCLLACATPLCSALAQDEDGKEQLINIRGFGTLGMSRLNTNRFAVISSFAQKRTVSDNWSPYLDSVLGLQADMNLSTENTMVFQGMWRPGDSSSTLLQLGYWEFQPMTGKKLRLGRIPTPLFRDSESFYIGYAQLPVRPALPVYSKLSAISHVDGGDIRWQAEKGDWVCQFQFFAGNSRYFHQTYLANYGALSAKVNQMRGVAFNAISGGLMLRASHALVGGATYTSGELEQMGPVIDWVLVGLRQLGRYDQASQLEIYRNLLYSRDLRYSSLGIDWQSGGWQLSAELTLLDPKSHMIGMSKAWQVMAARSFGSVTPYLFYSRQISQVPEIIEGAFAGWQLQWLRSEAATALTKGDLSMRSFGVGTRWELKSDVALKVQVERLSWNEPYVKTQFAQPGNLPNANLFSVSLDFAL